MRILIMALIAAWLAGCSARGSYESIQSSKRYDCAKLPASQYDACMEQANRSYDEYQRERQQVIKP